MLWTRNSHLFFNAWVYYVSVGVHVAQSEEVQSLTIVVNRFGFGWPKAKSIHNDLFIPPALENL